MTNQQIKDSLLAGLINPVKITTDMTTTQVIAKPVDGKRFFKGVGALKSAGAKYQPEDKTWAISASEWYKLANDRDVVAISEAPVFSKIDGQVSWVMPSTGEVVN